MGFAEGARVNSYETQSCFQFVKMKCICISCNLFAIIIITIFIYLLVYLLIYLLSFLLLVIGLHSIRFHRLVRNILDQGGVRHKAVVISLC